MPFKNKASIIVVIFIYEEFETTFTMKKEGNVNSKIQITLFLNKI